VTTDFEGLLRHREAGEKGRPKWGVRVGDIRRGGGGCTRKERNGWISIKGGIDTPNGKEGGPERLNDSVGGESFVGIRGALRPPWCALPAREFRF